MVAEATNQQTQLSTHSVDNARAEGVRMRWRTQKATRKRNLLDCTDKVLSDIKDPFTSPADRAGSVRALVLLDQQLAVLLGESKPPTISLSQNLDAPKKARMPRARVVDIESVVKSLSQGS